MPHIIVEYCEELFEITEIQPLLEVVHHATAQSGLFEESHIKTRAYPFKEYTRAGERKPYVHVQARIKSGRDTSSRKALGEKILTGLKTLHIPGAAMTVEIVEMDRESYARHDPENQIHE